MNNISKSLLMKFMNDSIKELWIYNKRRVLLQKNNGKIRKKDSLAQVLLLRPKKYKEDHISHL